MGGHGKEGGGYLEQDRTGQTTVEGIDGGLHPAVEGIDGGLHPAVDRQTTVEVLMEGYILQWTDDSGGY